MSDRIYRTKLCEDVSNRIIERIRTRQWSEGMKLPSEVMLAELFDVSRSTVRAAIKSLQIAGVLRSRSGSGTYVAESAALVLETRELASVMADPQNLFSLVQTRYILEPQLAALAAQNASDQEVEELYAILSDMEKDCNRHSLMSNGFRFHQAVARLSHNEVLYGLYQSVAWQLRGLRSLDALTLEVFLEGIGEHRAVADAIRKKDGALAKALMRSHLKNDYAQFLGNHEILE